MDDVCGDGWFGPDILNPNCRGGFDFTVVFEDGILNIAPAACFIAVAPLRGFYLLRQRNRVERSALWVAKMVVAIILAVIQLVVLGLVASNARVRSPTAIAAAVLDVMASVFLVPTIHSEHYKSIRPSFLVTAFLFVTVLFDAAHTRTEWLLSASVPLAGVLSAIVAVKLVLLGLEAVEKRKLLISPEKGRSTESTSGPLSRGFFVWLNHLFRVGFKTVLTSSALPKILESLSSVDMTERFEQAWHKSSKQGKNALMLTIIRSLRWELLSIAAPRLFLVGLRIGQPFLIGQAVAFLEFPNDEHSRNIGYGLIGGFALVFIGTAITVAWAEHMSFRAMTMMRGGLTGLVYRRMMSLPLGNVNESGAMSIMGADIETLADSFHRAVYDTWANVIQLGLATWLLTTEIGAVAIAPIIVAICTVAGALYIGRYVSGRQKAWLESIKKRVNFTSELLGSLKSVKMLGLTDRISSMIESLRDDELGASTRYRRFQSLNACIANCPTIVAQLFAFGAYAIVAKVQGSGILSTTQMITSISLINLLILPLEQLLGATPLCFVSMGCFQRIQAFISQDSRVDKRHVTQATEDMDSSIPSSSGRESTEIAMRPIQKTGVSTKQIASQEDAAISLRQASFGWDSTNMASLPRADATIPSSANGSLTIVVGPVGCGKSTFLKALIGETTVLDGEISISAADISFCEQTPWVISSSFKNNVLGESGSFDEQWYSTVLTACDLDVDLKQLPHGDATVVGSKGVKLSGGQKQRLALARAVYSRKRIAIFDDVFSGLDRVTEEKVFNNVFGPAGLLRQHIGASIILSTHSVSHLPQADHIIALGEGGKIVEQGSYARLKGHGGYVQNLEISERSKKEDESRDQREELEAPKAAQTSNAGSSAKVEDESRRTGNSAVWRYYAKALGFGSLSLWMLFLGVYTGGIYSRYIWLTRWAASDDAKSNSRLGYWLGVYAVWAALTTVGMIAATSFPLVYIAPKASKNLHSIVLRAALSAPMSFLSSTDTGLLVNRFSQDMRLVDMVLPMGLVMSGFQGFDTIGAAGLAIGAVPYVAPVIPVLAVILVLIQRFYLRTSRQLRLLEIETKAPLYSHFIESLDGLVTIRSFGWTQSYASKTLQLIDTAQRPYYLLLCIQRWLLLVLNLCVAGLAISIVSLAVALRTRIDPGYLGIALTMMMSLGSTLSSFIQFWTLLETSLGAVTRIKSFAEDTPNENLPTALVVPALQWPQEGALELRNVHMRYSDASDFVLHDISLSVRPREKIGICGRSGSGKSSLVLALLRLADIQDGSIFIDGVDITTVSRKVVRERLSCLTQEPFMFTGSVRLNIDPLGTSIDADIIAALECVGLWSVISGKEGPNGAANTDPLDATMDENFLSHGQRQLFCLARALLKRSSILILDEPTSSVDTQTDAQMQAIIRSHFQHCTIIMIAHRLDSLLDFDRIAVFDRGDLVEVGEPRLLLADNNSAFAGLYYA